MMLNSEDAAKESSCHSNDDFDVNSDEDNSDKSVEASNSYENCPESPYQSVEWEYFNRHLHTGQYFDNWISGLCCAENDMKKELTSKTIKAAIKELSLSSDKTLDKTLSDGSNDISFLTLRNSFPNESGNITIRNEERHVYGQMQTEHSKTEHNLQFRRKQTRDSMMYDVKRHSHNHIENLQEQNLTLQLSRFQSSHTDRLSAIPSPTEREQFISNLSSLVHTGQEKCLSTVYCDDKVAFKMLQLHIWLDLIAWHRNCTLLELESTLDMQRQTVPALVQEVLNFTVKYDKPVSGEVCDSLQMFEIDQDDSVLTVPEVSCADASDSIQKSSDIENCPCSNTLSQICQSCVDRTLFAQKQVEAIIRKTDHIESLYPSMKSLSQDHPECNSGPYICRVKTLNIWMNITKDLQQKISLLAKQLDIKDRLKAGWPCYCPEDIDMEQTPTPEVHVPRTSNLKIHFAMDLGNSPGTSNSDRSDISKESFPSSPEVQLSNPLEFPKKSNPESCEEYVRQIYHKYVDRTLRHKGLKNMYKQLLTLLRPILYRVHATLRKPKKSSSTKQTGKVVTDQVPTVRSPDSALPVKWEYLEELSSYGVRAKCFQLMQLPKFHQPFFFLLRVLLDVIHECLRLRLEQLPAKPSSLSVGQLIKECKEVLKAATQTRQKYINLAQTVRGESGNEIIETELDTFDSDLRSMLEMHLGYLQHRMLLLQGISQTTLHQKSYLEEEWSFMKIVCPHIPNGEATASKKFCFMASHLLNSIGVCLASGVNKHISTFQECYADDSNESLYRKNIALQTYRNIKHEFQDSSERARQVVTLAKRLRKELEIAAEFSILVPYNELLIKLRETNHIRVSAPNFSEHIMFVPGNLQNCERFVWQLVDMTCGHEPLDPHRDQAVYLVMMQCSKADVKGLFWDGPTLILEPSAEANITLSHVEVDGLLLVVNSSSQLLEQCKKFQDAMGKTVHVSKQETSCNHIIAEALTDLKNDALGLWKKLTLVVQDVEEKLDVLPLYGLDHLDQMSFVSSYRDVLHQGYKFAFEYQKAVVRLITGEARNKFYIDLASFAELWIKFVIEKCEEGRGTKPMWAKQGLEFLIAVYNSPYGHSLSDSEFEEVQCKINNCLRHLSSSVERSPIPSYCNSPKSGILSALHLRHQRIRSSLSTSSSDSALFSPPLNSESDAKRKRSRDETMSKNRNQLNGEADTSSMEKVRKALKALEVVQQKKLVDKGTIGQVSNVKICRTPLRLTTRTVAFPWQRCFKIGEGRFGKVYTAVNNTTGELIAMKEIRLQPNDHRAIKEALDEIRTFEGIKHPNVVRYYGVEVHREEMLIFMEYCNEGSLESAAQLNLPESLIRKYTRQLLDATNVLHENGIVHRDIKSANIFLTSDGNLKLGDFGSSIKLKNNTTMAGELCGLVGTPAYMAPEVFTKNIEGGHGRAADVWSIGCVVLEMFTAQRPWHDLENSYQIMFTVGMGSVPEIPDSLSDEAEDFLSKCLIHNPPERWTTSQLLSHPFTKIQEEYR